MERTEQLQDPSIPVDYDTPCEGLAPPDLKWHLEFAMAFAMFGKSLEVLMAHPAFKEAEDLGDYVDTISHLLSFRPHTSKAIEQNAYKVVFPNIDFDRLLDPETAAAQVDSKYQPDNKETEAEFYKRQLEAAGELGRALQAHDRENT